MDNTNSILAQLTEGDKQFFQIKVLCVVQTSSPSVGWVFQFRQAGIDPDLVLVIRSRVCLPFLLYNNNQGLPGNDFLICRQPTETIYCISDSKNTCSLCFTIAAVNLLNRIGVSPVEINAAFFYYMK